MSGTKLSQAEIRALLLKHNFPEASIPKAIAIAIHESGGDPGAVVDTRGLTMAELHAFWGPSFDNVKLDPRGEYACGLWQTNVVSSPQFDPERLLDTDYAADALFSLSQGGKVWTPWAVHG
jgi:Lysozyme like domain